MNLVFGRPWCTLQRFKPQNSVMYSMATLGCCFQMTFKLIGFYVPRSIADLHHQSFVLLKVRLFIPMWRIMLTITICFHFSLSRITYLHAVIDISRLSIQHQPTSDWSTALWLEDMLLLDLIKLQFSGFKTYFRPQHQSITHYSHMLWFDDAWVEMGWKKCLDITAVQGRRKVHGVWFWMTWCMSDCLGRRFIVEASV